MEHLKKYFYLQSTYFTIVLPFYCATDNEAQLWLEKTIYEVEYVVLHSTEYEVRWNPQRV